MRSRWGWTVDPASGCWNWTGVVATNGYGQYNRSRAHRVVYERLRGEIPEGLVIDHLCRNRLCVNPDHLEPVTEAENIRRGNAPTHVRRRENRCIRGHDLSNAYLNRLGHRQCRECGREHHRRYRETARRKAAAA